MIAPALRLPASFVRALSLVLAILCLALPVLSPTAHAKDSLGTFENWAAFRDPKVPRCYAIARPIEVSGRERFTAYAAIGFWPTRNIRGQFHVRLSRNVREGRAIELRIGERSFTLTGGGADAWATNRRMDAAILASIRSAERMTVRTTDEAGRRIVDRYVLDGAATALDAAALGCARLG